MSVADKLDDAEEDLDELRGVLGKAEWENEDEGIEHDNTRGKFIKSWPKVRGPGDILRLSEAARDLWYDIREVGDDVDEVSAQAKEATFYSKAALVLGGMALMTALLKK